MPNWQDTFGERRFWAVLYAEMLGAISELPEPDVVYSSLGVIEKDANDWFFNRMGWSSSEGEERPVTIRLALANGVELSIEFQLGDVNWYLNGPDQADARLGSLGGHWELPGLRWEEAAAIAAAAPGPAWMVTLLLLPIVWLTEGDDIRAADRAAASAWMASSLVPAGSATTLAEFWVKAVEGGQRYRWRQSAGGWVCTAEWSTRSEQRETTEIDRINRLIAVARGAA